MHQKGNLKPKIIEKLLLGSLFVPTFTVALSKSEKISVQAVYNAISSLKKEEIISLHNKYASLSLIWLAKEKAKLEFGERAYKASAYLNKLTSQTKGKEVFSFQTINELDLFWTHAYTILLERITTDSPQYSLMPHDFYFYGRSESDSFWIEKNIRTKKNARLIITHTELLDTLVMKARRRELGNAFEFLLHRNPLKQEKNVTYTLTGDYILKGLFDKKVNDKLENFVTKVTKLPLSKGEKKEIAEILATKGKFTLTIEKNKKRAESMEKKLRKYFE